MSESKEQKPGSIFSQPNWTVQGDVYNTAGDLILSSQSSNSDFLKAIQDLKAEIAKLADLDPDRGREIEGNLDSVIHETGRKDPSKSLIVSRLNTVKTTLESVHETTKGAWDIAKTVAKIAAWVAAFFV